MLEEISIKRIKTRLTKVQNITLSSVEVLVKKRRSFEQWSWIYILNAIFFAIPSGVLYNYGLHTVSIIVFFGSMMFLLYSLYAQHMCHWVDFVIHEKIRKILGEKHG